MLQSKTLKYIATTLLATIQLASATFDATSNDNVVLYWGQSSAGSQESLAYYCESDAADILVLSFLYEFPGTNDVPGLDFSSACSDTFSDGLAKCDTIASDIATCQSLGKKVLLSLGGASGSYGFSSDSDAETFATSLWNYFGEGSSDEKPFGTSIVDGFDFDIENNDQTGYVALVNKLRKYFDDGSKDYYISAAPQCVYPDASVGDLLSSAQVDFAFIQFYNNYCSVDGSFNWDTWADFASNTSPNKDIKLFLGLPASSSAAGSGYVDVDTVKNAVDNTIGSNSNFGGIMLWDASQAWGNEVDGQNYAEAMKSVLTGQSGSSASSTSSTSSTAAATTTSSSSTSTTATPTTSSTSSTSSAAAPTTTSTSSTSSTASPTTSSTSSTSTTATPTTSSTSSTSTTAATTSAAIVPVEKEATEPTTTESSTKAPTAAPTTTSSTPAAAPTTSSTPAVAPTTSSTPVVAPTTTSSTAVVPPATSSVVLTSATAIVPPTSTTAQDSTTISSTTVSSSTAATSSAAASSGFTDCSSLTGAAKAKCMNTNFGAGLFLGSASSCNEGDYACTSDGALAQCNFGEWVTFGCASGTTCYAYSSGDSVSIGCNFSSDKSQYTKRQEISVGHKHHFH